MDKKLIYITGVSTLAFMFWLLVVVLPTPLTALRAGAVPTVADLGEGSKMNAVYDVNFPMSKTPSGTISCYVPRFKETSFGKIKYLADCLGTGGEFSEDDDAYYFSGEGGSLKVYKYFGRLTYTAEPGALAEPGAPSAQAKLPTTEAAVELAASFIENNYLLLNYEEAKVNFDGNVYEVLFINRIGNIKNYSFNNTVTLDEYGNVLGLDYYFLTFERISAFKIKSMTAAFAELPVDFEDGTVDASELPIDLKRCQLVYIYENSVIQPAYLFEGEIAGEGISHGKTFQSFVKAAVFD